MLQKIPVVSGQFRDQRKFSYVILKNLLEYVLDLPSPNKNAIPEVANRILMVKALAMMNDSDSSLSELSKIELNLFDF